MKPNQKIILGFSFCIIAVLYWVLTTIGIWLTVDDSDAVYKFHKDHLIISAISGGLWLLDEIKFRYILILILTVAFWWLNRNPPSRTL